MQFVLESLTGRPFVTVGFGAFLSGVSLLYLVMQRTRKHRIKEAVRKGL